MPDLIETHLATIVSVIMVVAGGLIAWVMRIERRQTKSIINEVRLETMSKTLEGAIEKQEHDHAEIKKEIDCIRNAVQDTRESVARHDAKLDHIEKMLSEHLAKNR